MVKAEAPEWTRPNRVHEYAPNGRGSANGSGSPVLHKIADIGVGWVGRLLAGFSGAESVSRPYEEVGWVHAALKTFGAAVRQCPLRFYREDPAENPGAEPIEPGHPLNRLKRLPNPAMSEAAMLEAGVYHRKLSGEDFWFLFNESGRPVQLGADGTFDYPAAILPVSGSQVELIKDEATGFPKAWRYTRDGGKFGNTFPHGTVVHFFDYDPANPLRGLGDVAVLRREISLEFGAHRYLEAMLRNSGDPGGVVMIEQELEPDEEARLEQEAQERFSADNAGRWRVVSGKGIKYEQAKFGPRDMQFKELLTWTRDKYCSVLGVPKAVLGILDDATYSNYQTAVAQFWQGGNGVLAYMASVEDAINTHFLPRLRDREARNFIARFDTGAVEALRDDNESKWKLALEIAKSDVGFSMGEAARNVGLPHVETAHGEQAFMQINRAPIEDVIDGSARKQPLDGNGDRTPKQEQATPVSRTDNHVRGGAAGQDTTNRHLLQARGESGSSTNKEAHEARREYAKGYEAALTESEAGVKKAVRKHLRLYEIGQKKRLIAFAKGSTEREADPEYGPEDFERDPELLAALLLLTAEWTARFAGLVRDPLERVFAEAASGLADEVGGGPAPLSEDFLRLQRSRFGNALNDRLRVELRDSFARVVVESRIRGTLQDIVRKLLPKLQEAAKVVMRERDSRASGISRNASAEASGRARYETMQRNGIERHEWVTAGDELVRDRPPHSHVALDGEVREMGQPFRDNLKYPKDPDAAPGDTINCRCVARPVLDEGQE